MTKDSSNAVKTSVWYTRATFWSAIGICCGAIGIFFQLMDWGAQFFLPQIGLSLMVASIFAFALMRKQAGHYERLALEEGPHAPGAEPAVRAAVETSRWYTYATFWSAIGICCGAIGIFLQLMDWGAQYYIPQIGLSLMVISIGAFAVMRRRAGRFEVQAIEYEAQGTQHQQRGA